MGPSVFAVALEDGAERWRTDVRAPFQPLTFPSISPSGVAIGDATGDLVFLDASDGERLWDFKFDEPFEASSPVAVPGYVLAAAGSTIGAVDVDTGRLVWRETLEDGPAETVAAHAGGFVVGRSGEEGGLTALEPDPGGELLDVESSTVLHLDRGLAAFAAAAAALGAVLVLTFRLLQARRPGDPSGEAG